MTHNATMLALAAAQTPSQLLLALKDLKNSVIGNTWKKVEVAEDEEVMQLELELMRRLMRQLDRPLTAPDSSNGAMTEILQETAVIVGALGTVGPLTIQPLLASHASERLLAVIRHVIVSSPASPEATRLTPVLLRALRNVQVSIADVVWGHMWGVGSERKVVPTGLVGMEVDDDTTMPDKASLSVGSSSKGKGKAKESDLEDGASWKLGARRALCLIFQDDNLDALLGLLQPSNGRSADHQVLLPLYQMLSRLIALPSHRKALAARAVPNASSASSSSLRRGGSSRPHHIDIVGSGPTSSMLRHLMHTVADASANGGGGMYGRRNPKLLEAALDLLGALAKGEAHMAATIRDWKSNSERGVGVDSSAILEDDEGNAIPGFLGDLVQMMTSSGTGVRIAAASCLTNVLKADKSPRTSDRIRSRVIKMQLLDIIYKLLETETYEERIKLCFVLAALVSDDAQLQFSAAAKGCPTQLLDMLPKVEEDEASGEVGIDTLARHREGVLLALAALSFQHEPTRILIAEREPSIFPFLLKSLSHASYGVRAAACQLARALSRTVAILRTNLIDAGVGEEVIRTLKREVLSGDLQFEVDPETGKVKSVQEEGDEMEQHGLVEVAALATICNLITDFSPLRVKLVSGGHLEMLCLLATSPRESIAVNALWALKNLLFHAPEPLKAQVAASIGVDGFRTLLSDTVPSAVRAQALCIVQNLFADSTTPEMIRWLDMLGEAELMSALQSATRAGDVEIMMPALYTLSNLALGNERVRQSIMTRVELVERLSDAVIPALRAIRHLLESSTRSRKPRAGVVEAFQPFQLKARLTDMNENANEFDVRLGAKMVLEVLDRGMGRESVSVSSTR